MTDPLPGSLVEAERHLDNAETALAQAEAALRGDGPLDLTRLSRQIDLATAEAADVPLEARRQLLPRLVGLLAGLDRLTEATRAVRDEVGGDLAGTSSRRQGLGAYAPRGAR